MPLPVWGTSLPGAKVTVSFDGQTKTVDADNNGSWRVVLDPMDAVKLQSVNDCPEGKTMTVVCENDGRKTVQEIRNLIMGDVWLCAGQSNMAFPLARSTPRPEGLERADLRLFAATPRLHPGGRAFRAEEVRGVDAANFYAVEGWRRSDAESAPAFSAVAWHFGARVADKLDVPVGLVGVAVGGSPIEAWTPGAFFPGWLDDPAYPGWCRERARQNLAGLESARHPFEPGFLFEAGVRPWLELPVRGVLWYQGESNATVDGGLGRATSSVAEGAKITGMIAGWREAFGRPGLPFAMVQLPGMNREWAPFRDAQARAAAGDAAVHLAVTLDLGHPTDVHPPRKAEVGARLARLALAREYGVEVGASAPEVAGWTFREFGAEVRFDGPLRTRDGRAPRGFALAESSGRWYPAQARVEGDVVVLSCAWVEAPTAVRYAFSSDPRVNLVGAEGLPVGPFRTDDGPIEPPVRVAWIGGGVGDLGERLGCGFAVMGFATVEGCLAWEPDVVVVREGEREVVEVCRGLGAEPRVIVASGVEVVVGVLLR